MVFFIVLPQAQPRQNAPSSQFRVSTPNERLVFSITSNILFQQLLSFDIHTKNTRGVGSKTGIFSAGTTVGPSQAKVKTLTPLESALPQSTPITRLESALTKSLGLKSFRIRTCKKGGGREQTVNRQVSFTSSVTTTNLVSEVWPKEVVMAQSVASRPVAIKTRPMRGAL
jgi:hypothetical protein